MKTTRRRLIGEFLRSRRARLSPADVGLKTRPRRRTPGLRREEVAELAGVGVSWYTWLEQGRNVNPSAQSLQRLAGVLRLAPDEITYLFEMAGHAPPRPATPVPDSVSPSLQQVLDAMPTVPAYILNRRWDRIAWNQAALALLGDFSREPKPQLNMVRRVFTNPATRRYVANWEEIAQAELAEFAASCARYPEDPWISELVEELNAASPEFRAWWPERNIVMRRAKRSLIRHPLVGTIALEMSGYQVLDDPDLTLCLYVPLAEDNSSAKLARAIAQYRDDNRNPGKQPTGLPAFLGLATS